MKAPAILSAALVTLLPFVASCAVSGESPVTGEIPASRIVLTNAAGDVSLLVPANRIGPLKLHASGGMLFQSEFDLPTGAGIPWLRIGGKALPPLAVDPSTAFETRRSNDWQYVRLTARRAAVTPLEIARRHLLLVEPDLVVVLDEFVLSNSTTVTVNLPGYPGLQHDAVRDEWTTRSEHAALVTRILTLPKATQSWSSSADNEKSGCLTSTVGESGREFHHLAIYSVQSGQIRRSVAFKLLESDTAIGARIHRDGLPTLVAFRKAGCVGEANLTGLKFTAPVAVDIFRPKPRK